VRLDIILPIVVSFIYIICSVFSAKERNIGLTLCYFSYALANIGLAIIALELTKP